MLQIINFQLSALIAISSFQSRNLNYRVIGVGIAAVFCFLSLGTTTTGFRY